MWLEGANGTIEGDIFDVSEDVYIKGDDGSETKRYFGGVTLKELVLRFTPPVTVEKFTLYWSGNPPVELVLSN